MAYETLKDSIKQVIKQNGNQEITGDIMQATLLNIINAIDSEGYKFIGLAGAHSALKNIEKAFVIFPHGGTYANYNTTIHDTLSFGITDNGGLSWNIIATDVPYINFSEKRTFSIAEINAVENFDSISYRYEHCRIFTDDFEAGIILANTTGVVSQYPDNKFMVTPFINIYGDMIFALDMFTQFEIFGAFYDSNKKYIADITGLVFTNSTISCKAPSNAAYVRLNTLRLDTGNLFTFQRTIVAGKKPMYSSQAVVSGLHSRFPFKRVSSDLQNLFTPGFLYAKYSVSQDNFPKVISVCMSNSFKNTPVVAIETKDKTIIPYLSGNNSYAKYLSMQVEIPENAEYLYILERLPANEYLQKQDAPLVLSVVPGISNLIKAGDAISSIFETVTLGSKNLFTEDTAVIKNVFDLGVYKFDVSGAFYTDFISVKPNTMYYIHQTSEYSAIWYDEDKNYISHVNAKYCISNEGVYALSPVNAKYVVLNGLSCTNYADTGISEVENYADIVFARGLRPINENFYNKAILWFGTSIPAGYPHQDNARKYSYANRAAEMLGAVCLNKCVPNGVIRKANHDGSQLSGGRANLSFTNLNSAINYKNSMLDYVNSVDYFVFDYGVNDLDADRWDENNSDFTSLDVNTFVGAYNFVLKSLFDAKPDARVVLLTHYTDDNIQKSGSAMHNDWKKMNDLIKGIGEYWHIKTICLNEKTGWHANEMSNNLKFYIPDSIHPASATTDKGLEQLSYIIYKELLNFK